MKEKKPFVVTDRMRQLAKERGWPDPDSEVDAFIDHHEAGGWKLKAGVPIVNKEAAFRTWLRNAQRFKPIQGKPAVQPKQSQPKQRQPEMSEEQRRANLLRVRDLLKQYPLKGMKDR
jgi:hypothetical protein